MARVPYLPESKNPKNRLLDRESKDDQLPARLQSTAVKEGGLNQLIQAKKAKAEQAPPPPVQEKPIRVEVTHKFDIKVTRVRDEIRETTPQPVDGGELRPRETESERVRRVIEEAFYAEHGRLPAHSEMAPLIVQHYAKPKALPAPPKLVSQWGAVHAMLRNSLIVEQSKYLLPAPKPKTGFSFGVKS